MNYTLLRNATAMLTYGGHRFLIDPALDQARARPPVANTPNQLPNPLVEMPPGWEEAIDAPDALIVTHLHKDHFDDTAVSVLDPALPFFCQPDDVERLVGYGFSDLHPVHDRAGFASVSLVRTPAEHGTGEIGRLMAPVSGFMLTASNEPTLYIAGDTVWCDAVEGVIADHSPDVIIINGSGARFLEGDPIVMDASDIARVHAAAPDALLILVHLEAINHCLETRAYYREVLPSLGVPPEKVHIPDDGGSVTLA